MESIEFHLEGDYIELIQLLKAVGVAQTGGHAKIIVENGEVMRAGIVEQRKRAKLRKDDMVIVGNQIEIKIV